MGAENGDVTVVEATTSSEKSTAIPKKVVRLPKPDRPAMEKQLLELNDNIEKQQLRITAIRTAIESKKGNRKSVTSDVQVVRNELVQVRAEFKSALEVKQNIRTKLQAADLARDTLRNELKSMKDKLNFVKVNDIESEIKRIEDRMAHTTLSLDEEKRLVGQLTALNKSRDVVKSFGSRQEQLSIDEAARKETVDQLKAQDAVLNEIKAREGVLQQQLQAAKKKEESANGDLPNLIAEREGCIENIKATRSEIRKLRDSFKELENEYYSREREFREQLKKEREEKKKQFLEERKKRDEERKRRDAENAPPPYYMEITICEQLLAYLNKFIPVSETTQINVGESTTSNDSSGLVLKKRTEDGEEQDAMFTGMGGKKGNKKKKGGKKNLNNPAALTPSTKLPHSIETYTSFSTINVTVPVTVSDVQPGIEAITLKKAEYEKLAKVEEEKKAALAASENIEGEANGDSNKETAEEMDVEGKIEEA